MEESKKWVSRQFLFYQKVTDKQHPPGKVLEIQRAGQPDFEEVDVPPSAGAWEQFLAVRRGDLPNPSPPEVGLRMAYLWDAIRASAAKNGVPVTLDY